jgi:hypothetical protein
MPRKDDIRRHERVPQTAPVQVRWGERPELPWIEKWSQALDSCTFSSVVRAGYDKDRSFLSIEISADEVYFQAIWGDRGFEDHPAANGAPVHLGVHGSGRGESKRASERRCPRPITVLWPAARSIVVSKFWFWVRFWRRPSSASGPGLQR